MINITNNTAKQRLLIELTKMQQNIERMFSKSVGVIINRQFRKAARLIQDYRMNDVYLVFSAERNNMIELLRKYYRRIGKVFFDRFYEDIEKSFLNFETKTVIDEFWQEMEAYIGTTALRKVQRIDNTTRNMFRIIINKGLEKGKSNVEIAKDLRKTGAVQKAWRAKRIARTECHSASVHSLDVAAKTTRMMRQKEWLSARDSRTRINPFNHLLANGERVLINAFFQRTGESLMYPGDYQRGSAANIVNCRCVELFHTTYKQEGVVQQEEFIDDIQEINTIDKLNTIGVRKKGESQEQYFNRLLKYGNTIRDSKWERSVRLIGENRDKDLVLAYAKYTGKGYKEINAVLRKSSYLSQMDKIDIQLASEKAEKIYLSLNKAKLNKDIVVNRFVKSDFLSNVKEGGIFQDKGFISTSLGDDLFLEKGATNIKLEILLPKNSKAAFLSGEVSSKPQELEILIQKNSQFKILKIKNKKINNVNTRIYQMKLLKTEVKFKDNFEIKMKRISLSEKFIWDYEDIIIVKMGNKNRRWRNGK